MSTWQNECQIWINIQIKEWNQGTIKRKDLKLIDLQRINEIVNTSGNDQANWIKCWIKMSWEGCRFSEIPIAVMRSWV